MRAVDTRRPSLRQCTSGAGLPDALQKKLTMPLSATCWSRGATVTFGASEHIETTRQNATDAISNLVIISFDVGRRSAPYRRLATFDDDCLPAYLFRRLQSVMNAAARLIDGLRHSDHISDALISLHWLRAQERERFKTAVLMYKATHGTAPSYLSQLVRVADLPGRRSLRSARTNRVLVPSFKLSTVGGRAFPVAGPTIWNSLPDNVISSPSLSTFRRRLRTFLCQASFPDIITDPR